MILSGLPSQEPTYDFSHGEKSRDAEIKSKIKQPMT